MSVDKPWFGRLQQNTVPSGKRLHNYGKSPCLRGKSTIHGPCSIAMLNYQRVISFPRKNGWGMGEYMRIYHICLGMGQDMSRLKIQRQGWEMHGKWKLDNYWICWCQPFRPRFHQLCRKCHRTGGKLEPAICADDDCGVYEVLQLVIESGDEKQSDWCFSRWKLVFRVARFAFQRLLIKDFGAVIAFACVCQLFVA